MVNEHSECILIGGQACEAPQLSFFLRSRQSRQSYLNYKDDNPLLKIKKILANEQQLNTNDTMIALCLACTSGVTDYTELARLGIDHECYIPRMAEHREIPTKDLPRYIEAKLSANILGNRSTDHHNEAQYERTYPDYQLWGEAERQVINNGRSNISDRPQIYILRKPTQAGGNQPSPYTEDFVSLPKRMLRATLSFFNLQVKS